MTDPVLSEVETITVADDLSLRAIAEKDITALYELVVKNRDWLAQAFFLGA